MVPGGLATLEAKLSSILTKIDNMPLDAIAIDVKNALATLDQTLKDADTLVNRVDTQWVPEGAKTLEELRRAIASADSVLKNADSTLFNKDSPGAAGSARHLAGGHPGRAFGSGPSSTISSVTPTC